MASIFARRNAPVTTALLVINASIYILSQILGPGFENGLLILFGLSEGGLRSGFLWQPLTHMFLHGNLLHLLVNMVALWFAGRAVEMWIGPWRYLAVFFLGGILGGFLQIYSFPGGFLIGASGGVCAVLLAFTSLEPEMPITALLFFVLPVRLRAKYLGYGIILVSLVLPLVGLDPHVGHFAHLGGALVGLCYGTWLRRTGRFRSYSMPAVPRVRPAQWASLSGTREMDAILNKVVTHGLHSLTPEERARVEEWNRNA
jgi:membrane associated rhomboid family serine protease